MKVLRKKKFVKKFFSAAMSMVLVTSSVLPVMAEGGESGTVNRAAVNLPTPIYFFDFENAAIGGSSANATISSTSNGSKTGNATIKGSGEIVSDSERGKVFKNAVGGQKKRTDYLILPEDSLAYSSDSKGITIGFWTNAGDAVDYRYTPIFTAYGTDTNGTDNSWPMLALNSRLTAQVNCAGWSNLVAEQLIKGTSITEDETWLNDKKWHYYTATFDNEIVTVYVDGVIMNQWDASIDYTDTDGNEQKDTTVNGLYTNGSELKHICLGGNQAWNWADDDAAFMFDDVAIYNTALTEAQIYYLATGEIMSEADKTALDAAIIEADGIKAELYTEATVNNFQEELEAAKEIKRNGQATQEEVDAALAALVAAQKALEKKPVNLNNGVIFHTDITDNTSIINPTENKIFSNGYTLSTVGTSTIENGYIQLAQTVDNQKAGVALDKDVLQNISMTDGFTLSARINMTVVPNRDRGDWQDIFSITDSTGAAIFRNTYGFITYANVPDANIFPGSDCKNGFAWDSCKTYDSSATKTYTFTANSNTISMYVDGVLACSKTYNSETELNFQSVLTAADKLYIGRAALADQDTQGKLYGVTIYNRAINAAEAEALHTESPSVETSTTINTMEGSKVTIKDGETILCTKTVDATKKVVLNGLAEGKAYTYTIELPENYVEKDGSSIENVSFTAKKDDSDDITINAVEKSFILSQTELALKTNESAELELSSAAPTNTVIQSAKSSNDKIVTADVTNGKVSLKAVGAGNATITVTASNGLNAECTVTVTDIEVTSIELSETSVTVNKGETKSITAKAKPDNATVDTTITWTSNNKSVATVDEEGMITAVGKGSAIITASCGSVTAECAVTVKVPITEITLDQQEMKLSIVRPNDGDVVFGSGNLVVKITPEDTTEEVTIEWSSSKDEVATVNEDGIVTAVAAGDAIITATASNGMTATCTVIVEETNEYIAVENIALDITTANVEQGNTVTITATITPDNATNKTVTWESSNPDVATVTNGVVTAVAEGEATITATASDGATAECKVTVSPATVEVSEVVLNEKTISLKTGETSELTATVNPEDATDKTITWSSDNPEVATVDNKGVVTAVAKGEATITATASNGVTAECKVTVSPATVEVSEVILNEKTISLKTGETSELTATVNPEDATNKTITWSSDNPEVATVDNKGVVTAVAKGEVTITATASNGVTAECKVTVSQAVVEVSEVILNEKTISLKTGETSELTATVNPEDATDKTITWSSDNPNVATVDNKGVVTAVAKGEVTITATASNGVKAECKVTVSQAVVEVSKVVLNQEEVSLKAGETSTLIATVNPAEATDKTVTWTSSNNNVATVNENGVITAVAEGEATITATASNGVKAECKVTVKAVIVKVDVEGIVLDKYTISLESGEKATLTATVNPENASVKGVTWSSDNLSVATVDQSGNITAISAGTANIIVVSQDNENITAKCAVTVTQKQSDDNQPDENKPFIKGDDGTEGWEAIKGQIDKTEAGENITVDMNGNKVVDGTVISKAKEEKIDITFEVQSGIKWTIKASNIIKDVISDIDLSVEIGTNVIKEEKIAEVAKDKKTTQLSLVDNPDFGFTAILTINVGSENAGKFANLYYYNPKSDELEFMGASPVYTNGDTDLTFTHASDYVIVFDDKDYTSSNDDNKTENDDKDKDNKPESDNKDKDNTNPPPTGDSMITRIDNLYILMVCAIAAIFGVGVFNLRKKEK